MRKSIVITAALAGLLASGAAGAHGGVPFSIAVGPGGFGVGVGVPAYPPAVAYVPAYSGGYYAPAYPAYGAGYYAPYGVGVYAPPVVVTAPYGGRPHWQHWGGHRRW